MDIKLTIEYLRSVHAKWDTIIDNYEGQDKEKFIEVCLYRQAEIMKKLEQYRKTNPEEYI